MVRTSTVLRSAGMLVLLGSSAAAAYLVVEWDAIYPPAAFKKIEAIVDGDRLADGSMERALADIRMFHPGLALYAEGLAYEASASQTRDIDEAYRLAEGKYIAATAQGGVGQPEALVRLAKLRMKSAAGPEASPEIVDLLTRAYDLGSRRAGYELGNLYLLGELVDRDKAKAATYFQAVHGSIPEAALALASLIRDGTVSPPTSSYIADLRGRALWLLQQRVSRTGSAQDMLALAGIHESGGVGQEPDFNEALRWYEQAAGSGNHDALRELAKFYMRPDSGLGDLTKARAIFSDLAAKGDVSAMVRTADMLRDGKGGPANPEQAAALYKRAADSSSSSGQFGYAMALRQGRGVAADMRAGTLLLEEAARNGHVSAAVELGRAYAAGVGLPKDGAKALEWFKTAANRGSLAGIEQVALAYGRGTLVAANPKEYLAWGARAIDGGSTLPRLQSAVGAALISGNDLPEDRNRGFQLLSAAASAGRPEAILALARCYAFGIGVRQDAGKAVEWYEQAAQRGRVAAYWELGRAYASGFGVPMNENLAYENFTKAAANGFPAAMVDLARMYITGFGVSRDPERAAAWLEQAAQLGNANAMIELANIHIERLVSNASDATALEWLTRASATGSARAQYVLALQYLAGGIVERDLDAAETLLASAAAQHNAPAKVRLKLLKQQESASQ